MNDKNTSYADELAAQLTAKHGVRVTPLGGGIPTPVADLTSYLAKLEAAKTPARGELFIELDLNARFAPGMTTPHLYPVAVRVDRVGDMILTVTDADTAQFGHAEVANRHVDVGQRYDDQTGKFYTVCSCGEECEGLDPDDADSAHFAHQDAMKLVEA